MKRKSSRFVTMFLVVAVAACMLMPGAAFATDNAGSTSAPQARNAVSALNAVPLVDPVEVTFDANKGKVNGQSKYTVQVEKGSRIGALPTPTKKNSMFKGWYTKRSGGSKIKESAIVKGNVTYFARWAAGYTVTFNTNGGDTDSIKKGVEKGKQLGKLPAAPARVGFKFLGWYTKKYDGEKVKTSVKVNKNRTYYAHWAFIMPDGKAFFQFVNNTTKKVIPGVKIEYADMYTQGSVLNVVYRNIGSKTLRTMYAYGYELAIIERQTGSLIGNRSGNAWYVGGSGKTVRNFKKGSYYTDKVTMPSDLASTVSAMKSAGYDPMVIVYNSGVSATYQG